MILSDLLCGFEYSLCGVSPDTDISSPVSDSRRAEKDSLFLCIRGTKRNGGDYIADALARGAAAVVTESTVPGVPCVTVENVRRAAAYVWNNYCGEPARGMRLFGITGTNGKTSTAEFLYSILKTSGRRTGVIGTAGARCMDEKLPLYGSELLDVPAAMTTPDPMYLYGALAEMKRLGAEDVVMEVSSHGIYQKKTDALNFFCGAFTNLSPEHLDLHGDMETYFSVKKSFLDNCKILVYNRDDEYGKRFCPKPFGYGMDDVLGLYRDARKTVFDFSLGSDIIRVETTVPGDFTVYNTMAAAACAHAAGVSPDAIAEGVRRVESIPGRMERAVRREEFGFSLYIDFAHTPAAFERVLSSLKKTTAEKLTVVFGCGGDRDPSKRAPMGGLAARYADKIIVTSDNPRNEDRGKIIEEILKGIPQGKRVTVIPDRKTAILFALETVREGETVLLAGKGTEEYEIEKGEKRPFSEKEIIAAYLTEKYGK